MTQDNLPQDSLAPSDGIDGADKLHDHHRRQLSALMDGALPPDEARFLLRRLQHDGELGGCWERWQMTGEVLRGRLVAPLPQDFSRRVASAIAREPIPSSPAKGGPRWMRWSGGAIAASAALVALFMARQQSPVPAFDQGQPAQIVAASSAPATPIPQPVAPQAPASDPDAAATLAAATIAVAEVPRRVANRRSSRSQSQRAAIRTPARVAEPVMIAVNGAPASSSAAIETPVSTAPASTEVAASDPFAKQSIAPSRPWPSAVLPQYSASSALNVDYGTASYYPFQPRLPASRASNEPSPNEPSASDAAAPDSQDGPQR